MMSNSVSAFTQSDELSLLPRRNLRSITYISNIWHSGERLITFEFSQDAHVILLV